MVHDANYICNHGRHRKFVKNEETRLRSKVAWQTKRAEIKDRAFNLCEVCADEGDFSAKDLEVHHIVKIKDDPSGYLDNDNLVALCVTHHKQADEGIISAEYLFELARRREERTR